jgi:hypothetical protein
MTICRHNPENKHFGNGEEKKKRVAVKKEKAEEKKDEDKKKRDEGQTEESIKDVDEFLDTPNIIVPEGDTSRYHINNEDGKKVSMHTKNMLLAENVQCQMGSTTQQMSKANIKTAAHFLKHSLV